MHNPYTLSIIYSSLNTFLKLLYIQYSMVNVSNITNCYVEGLTNTIWIRHKKLIVVWFKQIQSKSHISCFVKQLDCKLKTESALWDKKTISVIQGKFYNASLKGKSLQFLQNLVYVLQNLHWILQKLTFTVTEFYWISFGDCITEFSNQFFEKHNAVNISQNSVEKVVALLY